MEGIILNSCSMFYTFIHFTRHCVSHTFKKPVFLYSENYIKIIYYIALMNNEYIEELNYEISKLKEKLLLTENELNKTKHKLNTCQTNSKKYYKINKNKIIERVKNYNKQNNYNPSVSYDKRKEYNKIVVVAVAVIIVVAIAVVISVIVTVNGALYL